MMGEEMTKQLSTVMPRPSYGGGAPSYGAEGEGHTGDLRKISDLKSADSSLAASGPSGHLPRRTGEANDEGRQAASLYSSATLSRRMRFLSSGDRCAVC